MKHLKTFENFNASPLTKPDVKPDVKPTTRPSRPSPIRRDRPSVEPAPKANDKNRDRRLNKKFKPMKSSAEDVVDRYNELNKK